MGTSGNSDCQWASRSALKDFTEDVLTISAGNLFQNGTARMVKANWRRRVQHRVTRTMLCPRVSQRANQEAQLQRPLSCLCSRCTFICEKLKSPIMLYEFGLQMHHLSKCVSKILSGICLKHWVYLEVNNNHKCVKVIIWEVPFHKEKHIHTCSWLHCFVF